jgi:arylsulfatase A-like enzyme
MIDHDKNVGEMLDLLDKLGITENTLMMYSTDNGPHMNSWPDAGMTPFRSEKNTNWEGAFRVPLLVRWLGKFPAGVVSNEIVQHHDWLPTLLAMAGEPDIVEKCKKGYKAGNKLTRSTSTVTICSRISRAKRRRALGRASSTSMTTEISWRSGSITGRWCSWSSAAKGRCKSG